MHRKPIIKFKFIVATALEQTKLNLNLEVLLANGLQQWSLKRQIIKSG
jgi:hypothetical protein